MPKASKETASQSETVEGYEGHFENFDGGYTVAFETYTADTDLGPFFEGLPNNQCQAAHWGYVIKGKLAYDFGDHEETYETGDAYYVPPGHVPKLFAGTEVIEFSPTEELQETIEVVTNNMEKAGARA
jgi:mannose-6-phosphate isomerase-like protein (cupin superfamily)